MKILLNRNIQEISFRFSFSDHFCRMGTAVFGEKPPENLLFETTKIDIDKKSAMQAIMFAQMLNLRIRRHTNFRVIIREKFYNLIHPKFTLLQDLQMVIPTSGRTFLKNRFLLGYSFSRIIISEVGIAFSVSTSKTKG